MSLAIRRTPGALPKTSPDISEIPHRYYFVVTPSGVDWSLTAEEPVVAR